MTKSILIVEDNDMNMKLFDDLLQAHNYTTLNAPTCAKAKHLLRSHQPDLILMDVDLPDGDGLSLTQHIKETENFQQIPVIAITAFAMKGDRERMIEAGCDDYISKPIDIAQFLATIEGSLQQA